MIKTNTTSHLYGFTDLNTLNERGPIVISHGKGIYVYDGYWRLDEALYEQVQK